MDVPDDLLQIIETSSMAIYTLAKHSAAAADAYKHWRTEGSSAQQPHRLGEIFAANVWVTIFPFCTMKVSVPSSKRLSAVSALHTM